MTSKMNSNEQNWNFVAGKRIKGYFRLFDWTVHGVFYQKGLELLMHIKFHLASRTRPLETSSLSQLSTTDTIRSDLKEKRVSFTCASVAIFFEC